MLDSYNFRMLNELKIGIRTEDIAIEVEWFHVIRRDDFCNPKWHMHSSVEMHCVLEGEDEFCLPNDHIVVHAGQCILIPSKTPHKRIQQSGDLLKFSINFSVAVNHSTEEADFLRTSFQAERFQLVSFPEEAQQLMTFCLKEANDRKYGFLTNISAHLLSALVILAREISQNPAATYPVALHKVINDERYQIIETYILTNMSEDVSVQAIARYMNLSTKQLGRIVRTSSDYRSVSDMVQSLRIDQAKELLRRPELSNDDVAKLIGFSSEYYFNRVFKEKVGLPPGRYRKSLRAV